MEGPTYRELMDVFIKNNQFDQTNKMEFEVGKDHQITYHFTPLKEHESSPNHCHGGALAGLMDSLLGVSALSFAFAQQKLTSTIEFKINFIKPVRTGTQLRGESEIIHAGQSLIVVGGKIFDANNKTVGSGQGTFNLYPISKRDFGIEN